MTADDMPLPDTLIIEYDPLRGICVPDGLVSCEADKWISSFNSSSGCCNVRVGSEALINEFRTRIRLGILDPKHVEFRYNGETVVHNDYAQLESWPDGFCCTYTNHYKTLITGKLHE